jgi:hypothetical protein
MSMNRFVGLGIFALSSSVLLTMAACDDSATAPGPITNGGAPGATSASRSNNTDDGDDDDGDDTDTPTTKASTTKASTTKAGTTKAGTGGTSGKTSAKTTAEGGADNNDTSDGEGGTTGGGGDKATDAECELGTTDILKVAAASDSGNWIGGIDDQDNDNPCGVQGAFYAYSDPGTDGKNNGEDDSLREPGFLKDTQYDNPCAGGKCCISGETVLWPKAESGGEINYKLNWGAGLGLTLNDGGESNPGKKAYSGSAKGFKFKLEGELAGGQTIRIMYTQSETDENAPFSPLAAASALGTEKTVLFEDVSCPNWATDCTESGYGGPNPYDLQIQVVGGEKAGKFNVCLTSLIPVE